MTRTPQAIVYSAWEECPVLPDGAEYRSIHGDTYRKIGSSLLDLDTLVNVHAADLLYERECRRAYQVITAVHPEVSVRGVPKAGEIIIWHETDIDLTTEAKLVAGRVL